MQTRLDYSVQDFINVRKCMYQLPNVFDSRVVEKIDDNTEIIYVKHQKEIKGILAREAIRRDFVILSHVEQLPDGRWVVAGACVCFFSLLSF